MATSSNVSQLVSTPQDDRIILHTLITQLEPLDSGHTISTLPTQLLALFTHLHAAAVQEYATACGKQTSGENIVCKMHWCHCAGGDGGVGLHEFYVAMHVFIRPTHILRN